MSFTFPFVHLSRRNKTSIIRFSRCLGYWKKWKKLSLLGFELLVRTSFHHQLQKNINLLRYPHWNDWKVAFLGQVESYPLLYADNLEIIIGKKHSNGYRKLKHLGKTNCYLFLNNQRCLLTHSLVPQNIRSLRMTKFLKQLLNFQTSFLYLAETWLLDSHTNQLIKIDGYKNYQHELISRKGVVMLLSQREN